jgi:sarcosine/dimethylglycine N-methyltransferase
MIPNTAERTIAQYSTGELRAQIEAALIAAGKDLANLADEDLGMLEDFHSFGRFATVALIDLAKITTNDRVLDAGTGIGGTARLLAAERGCQVIAVDLTPEYCETARWLNDAVGLGDRIEVLPADVTDLPFDDASFDVVVTQHVQMNVADKHRLYAEAHRVLAPGGRLALWDVTAGLSGSMHFPVPWANSPEQSHLVKPDRLVEILHEAGFIIDHWNDLTESVGAVMGEFFAGEQPLLGLHVFVPDFEIKVSNLLRSLAEGQARLIQGVATAGVSPSGYELEPPQESHTSLT